MMKHKQLVIDPPEGWRYGFPRIVPSYILGDEKMLGRWLIKQGYPKKHIDLAIKYSRYWEK